MTKIKPNIFKIFFLSILAMLLCIPAVSAESKKQFVVVIDAGHGGKDVGAQDNNAQEKTINLNIALKLEEILKKKKGFKVIMTRDGDKFVSLKDRAAKANNAKADLFISIHTNSLDMSNPNRKTVSGSSVYVLGPHRDSDNLAVARRENSVIAQEKNHEEKYEGFDPSKDESYIIFEMAQKASINNSIGFAKEVAAELAKTAQRQDRGVHQAGFLVLRETAMPAVLIEVDFICNPNSAKFINSSAGQKKIAQAIANSVVVYRDKLKKSGDKAYADASMDADDNSGDTYVLVGRQNKSTKRATSVNAPGKRNPTTGPRKRRSAAAERASIKRNVETDHIAINSESTGVVASATTQNTRKASAQTTAQPKKMTAAEKKKAEKERKKREKEAEKARKKQEKENKHKGEVRTFGNRQVVIGATAAPSNPRSLKSSKATVDTDNASVKQQMSNSFGNSAKSVDNYEAYDDEVAVSPDDIPAAESNSEAATARKRSSASHTAVKTSGNNKMNQQKADKQNDKKKVQDSEEQKNRNAEHNRELYEAAKQKSIDNYQTSSAPKSLKSKKKKKK